MFVRLKLEETREGLVATISQRGDDGRSPDVLRFFSFAARKRQNKERKQWRESWD